MEQERMYGLKGEVPEDEDFIIPLGVADVKREGTDCTIVARSMTVPLALQAAERIQAELDVSVEVIDPRTIKPLDIDTIVNSVKKTNRLVIAEESHYFASVGARISHTGDGACIRLSRRPGEADLDRRSSDARTRRISKALALPDVEKIIAAVKEVCYCKL
jgi:pyruvate dehydrogenase E1 component beta subunit